MDEQPQPQLQPSIYSSSDEFAKDFKSISDLSEEEQLNIIQNFGKRNIYLYSSSDIPSEEIQCSAIIAKSDIVTMENAKAFQRVFGEDKLSSAIKLMIL